MPITPDSTRTQIVAAIPAKIATYNAAYPAYNVTYGAFIAARAAGIAAAGSLAAWLATPDAAPAFIALLDSFGMNARNSELVAPAVFAANLADLPAVPLLAAVPFPIGTIAAIEPQLRTIFNCCAAPGTFSKSGGFVIGSKTAHCVLPDLCPMLDNEHIGKSLYNIAREQYLPPGNNWAAYLGRPVVNPPNPSPRGAGRNNWDAHRFTQAIGFYEALYSDWQAANGNLGIGAFLGLDPTAGTTGIFRVLDKVLW